MKFPTIGASEIPVLGLGTWQLEGPECAASVLKALELGYRHLDTARIYGNEREVGVGLRESSVDREDVFLTTKLWMRDGLTRNDVHRQAQTSLSELRVDYLDLLLVHWPSPATPIAETLAAMRELQERELVRYLGVSNFPVAWLREALREAPIVCNQVEYHPLLPQDELLSFMQEQGVALTAYSPLAQGQVERFRLLKEIGAAHGKSASQVALRWLIQQPGVGAIPRSTSLSHLRENSELFDFELSADQLALVFELARRNASRTVDPQFAPTWD